MMNAVCVVLGGRRGLDQENLRQSVARIPEVSREIREAQKAFDNANLEIDIFSQFQMGNFEYLDSPHVASLVAAITQIGLFERFKKTYTRPQFVLGNTNGTKAIDVIKGKISTYQMTEQSYLFSQMKKNQDIEKGFVETELAQANIIAPDIPQLTGILLEEYGLYDLNEEENFDLYPDLKDCSQLMLKLWSDYQVEQFVHIGPTNDFREKEVLKDPMLQEISLNDAISMDPILNVYWKSA